MPARLRSVRSGPSAPTLIPSTQLSPPAPRLLRPVRRSSPRFIPLRLLAPPSSSPAAARLGFPRQPHLLAPSSPPPSAAAAPSVSLPSRLGASLFLPRRPPDLTPAAAAPSLFLPSRLLGVAPHLPSISSPLHQCRRSLPLRCGAILLARVRAPPVAPAPLRARARSFSRGRPAPPGTYFFALLRLPTHARLIPCFLLGIVFLALVPSPRFGFVCPCSYSLPQIRFTFSFAPPRLPAHGRLLPCFPPLDHLLFSVLRFPPPDSALFGTLIGKKRL